MQADISREYNNENKQSNEKGKAVRVIFICFIAALAGLLFGLDTGYVNGALQLITRDFSLTIHQTELVTSILLFGAVLGSLSSGVISHALGRKTTLVLAAFLFSAFSLVGVFANDYIVLLVSRLFLGIALGVSSFIAPLYLCEIAPPRMRGGLIALYQLMITIGILAMFISNYLLKPYGSWHLMMLTIVVPAIAMLICSLFLPRSPRWLIMKGRVREAEKTLTSIRHVNAVNAEMREISDSVNMHKGGISGLWKTSWLWKIIALGVALQLLQQLSGINAFMYYSSTIFKAAGFSNAYMNTIIMGLVNVLTTVVAIALVDRLGRKPILYLGLSLLIISLLVIGCLFNLKGSGATFSRAQQMTLFVASLTFVFAFAVSLGPIVWIICAEICPLEYRDLGITFSTTTNWLANTAIGGYTLSLFNTLGYGNTFYLFAFFCFAGVILVKFFTPETKNISLEAMEKKLRSSQPLRRIGS